MCVCKKRLYLFKIIKLGSHISFTNLIYLISFDYLKIYWLFLLFELQSNSSRGPSAYPGSGGGGPSSQGPYPPPPQPGAPLQTGGPQQQQPPNAGNSQYSPYPQRYPTPPSGPTAGPNHRPTYPPPPHQVRTQLLFMFRFLFSLNNAN